MDVPFWIALIIYYWSLLAFGCDNMNSGRIQGTCCIHCEDRWGGSRLLQKRVSFYDTTWHHIPEDSNLHIHCHKNLKRHINSTVTYPVSPELVQGGCTCIQRQSCIVFSQYIHNCTQKHIYMDMSITTRSF
jgi:hypothetical protein